MTHDEKKKQPIETNPDLTEVIEQGMKAAVITDFRVFRKLRRINEETKRSQTDPETKLTVSEVKTRIHWMGLTSD